MALRSCSSAYASTGVKRWRCEVELRGSAICPLLQLRQVARRSAGQDGPLQPPNDPAVSVSNLRFRRQQQEAPAQEQQIPVQYVDEFPAELEGLAINDAGLLVDEKSGKVINEFGATRWDVSVRAMRGELNPPAWVDNTELSPGVLLSSLVDFPTVHDFSIVGQAGVDKQTFVADVRQLISRVCQAPVEDGNCTVKERLGGKYISMTVGVMVRAPEVIQMVWEELGKDSRVKMRY